MTETTQPSLFIENFQLMTMLAEAQRELDGLRRLDSQVISAVFDRYYPQVYRFVKYRLEDEALVEDITSEVFVRLIEAVNKRRGPKSNLKAWLYTTASHIVSDHLRRVYRRPTVGLSTSLVDDDFLPPDKYDQEEERRLIRSALSQLTSEQQQVLSLRFGVGLSLEETANAMNKKVNAVKALQFRAMAALNRQIEEVSHG